MELSLGTLVNARDGEGGAIRPLRFGNIFPDGHKDDEWYCVAMCHEYVDLNRSSEKKNTNGKVL